MIKSIILDVDGVIIGEKIPFNSPWPHQDVIDTLRAIHAKGILISLCTAKPYWAIEKIIKDANLNNLHIVEGGAVLVDPIDNVVLTKHIIPNVEVQAILSTCFENNIYVEVYTLDEYIIQKSQTSDTTKQHTHILQREPKIVESLKETAQTVEVTKIMPIAHNEEDKKRVSELLKSYEQQVSISWGVHPVALPSQFGIVIKKGISKKEGAIAILKNGQLSFENTLGIGDSTSDWQFIEHCGYAGAMDNASNELKSLVLSKGKGNAFIGKSVDENGILDIFNYFEL